MRDRAELAIAAGLAMRVDLERGHLKLRIDKENGDRIRRAVVDARVRRLGGSWRVLRILIRAHGPSWRVRREPPRSLTLHEARQVLALLAAIARGAVLPEPRCGDRVIALPKRSPDDEKGGGM